MAGKKSMAYERSVNRRRPPIFNRFRQTKSPRDFERAATMVYVLVRDDGMVKVGISSNVEKRAASIRSSVPDGLTADHKRIPKHPALDVEQIAHHHLKPWHVRGEWFACSVEIAVIAIDAADGDDDAARFLTAYREHEVVAKRAREHRHLAQWMHRYKSRTEPERTALYEAVAAGAEAYAKALDAYLKAAYPQRHEQASGFAL